MSEQRISAGCRTTDMHETVNNCAACSYPDRCGHWCHQADRQPTVPVLAPGCAVCVRLAAAVVEARCAGDPLGVQGGEARLRRHQRDAHGMGARDGECAP